MSDCKCRIIGGSEDSVMGLKTSWVVEWRELDGKIWTSKVLAHDILQAVSAWKSTQKHYDERFVLSVRKE